MASAVTSSPRAEAGQPALLLLLGAEIDQVRSDAVGVDPDARGVRHRELGQLLGEHRREPRVAAPDPPYASGTLRPSRPCLPSSSHIWRPNSWFAMCFS